MTAPLPDVSRHGARFRRPVERPGRGQPDQGRAVPAAAQEPVRGRSRWSSSSCWCSAPSSRRCSPRTTRTRVAPRHPDRSQRHRILLGTDSSGRDVCSRLLLATRHPRCALARRTLVIAAVIGVVAGLVAGYYGKWFDGLVLGRLEQSVMALPGIVVLLAARACSARRCSPRCSSSASCSRRRSTGWSTRRSRRCATSCTSTPPGSRGCQRRAHHRPAHPHRRARPGDHPGRDHRRHRDRHPGRARVPRPRATRRCPPGAACSTTRSPTSITAPLLMLWPSLAIGLTCIALALLANALRDELERAGSGTKKKVRTATAAAVTIISEPVIEHHDGSAPPRASSCSRSPTWRSATTSRTAR